MRLARGMSDAVSAEPRSSSNRLTPRSPPRTFPSPRRARLGARRLGWLRRLLPVALAHPALLGATLCAALVSMTAGVAVPALLGLAINDALRPTVPDPSRLRAALGALADAAGVVDVDAGQRLPLELYAAALLGLGTVAAVARGLNRYSLYRMAHFLEADLRSILYDHLTRLSFSFYDRVQSGQLTSRANSDVRAIQMLLTFAPLMLISWLSFALALAFMLSVHVGLTIACVLALPGVFLVGVHMRRQIFPLSWMQQSRLADLTTLVDESINGVRVIQAFARERHQIGLVARAAQRIYWVSCQLVEARARHAPLMENIARVGPALVLLYGGHLVMTGAVEGVGTLVTFSTYMVMLQAPFRVLGFFMTMSERARASAGRIFEIIDEPVTITDAPGARALAPALGEVELRDVTFSYDGEHRVLDGCSLRVEAGECVAVVGRTGSGKTSIARLVPRFYDVSGGAVLIDGQDVRELSLESLRGQVGLALDEPFLFSRSVHDNIAYGRPGATRAEVERAARAARAHGFICKLARGYDTVVGERGYTLSGGQRQRVALARVFLINPPILILDDATSAIDVQTEAEIHAALAELARSRTTIVIAHRESTIALATRVALLEQGRIVAAGTHAELLEAEPRYAAALDQQRRAPAAPAPERSARPPRVPRRLGPSGDGELSGVGPLRGLG